ncbi:TPA: hypothetical protein ACH3X1_011529 [Trebouxia sp. C0004]
MPHTARPQAAALSPGLGLGRAQPALTRNRVARQRIDRKTCTASSLITAPVLTELMKLTLSVTNTNTIASVSQAVGPNYLVWYSILCALTASVGTWVVHFTSYLWHNVFEGYILQEESMSPKEKNLMHGVDVTHSRFFDQPKVKEAVAFAAEAHRGQARKTKEPYVAHCIETACIVEEVLDLAEDSEYISRAESAIIAALLHDVLDDTSVKVQQIEDQFGTEVASMVSKVSQLSSMNQLLRRRRRQLSGRSRGIGLGKEEEEQLRTFIVNMVSEPLVLVIKLADRLHNMRTVFALKRDKQKAVATETLQAELEDLCFAVLHPHEYTALRNELDSIWGLQQVTDLVPVQAETLLSQAMAGIKTAAEIAAATPDAPQPRLPPPSPVPRPALSPPFEERSQQAALDSAATAPATSVQDEQQQSVQSVAGDLYAHSERGMVRAAAQARINPRQQKALQSGLLRLSPSVQRKSSARRSTAAVLEPPEVATSSFGPSQSSASAPPSASVPPSRLKSHDDIITPLSRSSDANSQSLDQSQSSTSSAGPASHSPKADSTQSSARAIPGTAEPALGSSSAASDGPVRVIRGRAPRQALAAKKANAERQKSGSKAGPSGRVTADYSFLSADQQQVRQLVKTVLPFHAMGFKNHRAVPAGAAPGLKVLEGCARVLLQTIYLEGYSLGLEVRVEGRLKSMYSIYKKMIRKKIPVRQVYDARALRVIVGDEGGSKTEDAWAAAYRIQPAVHRLWRKVGGEYDDYIVNPKRSGYQSLHTAVKGPGGVPMEVQIRTAHMHEVAEYGAAAHWTYKENTPKLQAGSDKIQERQPVVCHRDGQMRNGVVYSVLKDGLQFLAVVNTSNAVPVSDQDSGDSLASVQELYQYAHDRHWFRPGHGDLKACLEKYSKCQDGRFRREDHTGYKLPYFCTPLQAWSAPASNPGGDVPQQEGPPAGHHPSGPVSTGHLAERAKNQKDLNLKTLRLRGILEWRDEVTSRPDHSGSSTSSEVMILIWPAGEFKRLPRGTTASEIVHDQGWAQRSGDEFSRLVNVNNRLVPENTVLQDGDFLVLSRELLTI